MKIKQAPLSKFVKINPEGITQGYAYQLIEYIDISSVGSGQLVEQPKEILLKDAPSRAKRIVRNKDIILATVRPNLRSFLFIKNPNNNTVVSTGFAVLRTKASADPHFIYYAITDNRFTGYLTNNTKGTSYPAVDSDIVLRGCIPDFDFKRQQCIGDILSTYDDLIDINRRRIHLLEESARLFFREWFVYFRFPGHEKVKIVDGLPEGWRKATTFDALQVMSGGTPKTTTPDFWDGEIPFYTPKDSVAESFVLDTEKHLTELGLKNCNSRLFRKDTIFMTARGTVGNLNIAQRPMAMNQSCYALVGHDGISQKFLFCALQEVVQHFQKNAVGAVFDAIIVDTFKFIPFIIPDRRLVTLFEKIIDPTFRQIENLLQQNQKLAQARDLLLPRLMSGAIEV